MGQAGLACLTNEHRASVCQVRVDSINPINRRVSSENTPGNMRVQTKYRQKLVSLMQAVPIKHSSRSTKTSFTDLFVLPVANTATLFTAVGTNEEEGVVPARAS